MKKIFLFVALIAVLFFSTNQILAVTTNCTETGDVGQDLFAKGTIKFVYNGQNKSATDYCANETSIMEYYCKSGSAYGSVQACTNGCDSALGTCKQTGGSTTTAGTCTETDDGQDPWKYGVLTDSSGKANLDYCVTPSILGEYYCRTENASSFQQITCKYGCQAGACKTGCTDSDGGINYNQKGTVILDITNASIVTQNKYFEDSCNGSTLKEYSCQDGALISEDKICPNGCGNGACFEVAQTHTECRNQKCVSINSAGVNTCTLGNDSTCVNVNGPCTDSDVDTFYSDGKNPFVLGNVLYNGMSFWDQCTSGNVFESFCNSNGARSTEIISCPNGCSAGVCNPTACNPSYSNCTAWSSCVNGSKTQTCTQTNCPSLPPTKTVTESCSNICTPIWNCGNFAACAGGQKTQICTQTNCPLEDRTKMITQSCTVSTVACIDTDGGETYDTKGTLTLGSYSYTDTCHPTNANYLYREYYCDSTGRGGIKSNVFCPGGCLDGACKASTTTCTPNYTNCTAWSACVNGTKTQTCTQTNCASLPSTKTNTESCTAPITCTDSDNGKEYFTKGFTINSSSQRSDDTCSGNQLTEYYCKTDGSGESMFESRQCDNSIGAYKCEAGACVATTCTPNYTNCDAWTGCSPVTLQRTKTCTQSNCPDKDRTKIITESCSINTTTLPIVNVKVNGLDGPITLAVGSKATLSWTSENATSCGGSPSALIGSQEITVLSGQKTYTARCANSKGNATDTVTVIGTTTPPPPPTSGTCTDSDNGKIYNAKGTTTDVTGSSSDSCHTNVLTEYYCDASGVKKYESYVCDNGCYNGACSMSACTDSDNGKNYWFKGYGINSSGTRFDDICMGDSIIETYCNGNTLTTSAYTCPNGCFNDACRYSNDYGNCFDSDAGLNAQNKGFLIVNNTSYADTCVNNNTLTEYSCSTNGQLMKIDLGCNSDCIDGACSPKETCIPSWTCSWSACASGTRTQTCRQSNCPSQDSTRIITENCTTSCTDSDGGGNNQIYSLGTTKGAYGTFGTDFCAGNYLGEYYCNFSNNKDGLGSLVSFLCPKGCDYNLRACIK